MLLLLFAAVGGIIFEVVLDLPILNLVQEKALATAGVDWYLSSMRYCLFFMKG